MTSGAGSERVEIVVRAERREVDEDDDVDGAVMEGAKGNARRVENFGTGGVRVEG